MPNPGAVYFTIGRLSASSLASISNKTSSQTIQTRKGPESIDSSFDTIDTVDIRGLGFDGEIEGSRGSFGYNGQIDDFKTTEGIDTTIKPEDLDTEELTTKPNKQSQTEKKHEIPKKYVLQDSIKSINTQDLIAKQLTIIDNQAGDQELIRRMIDENIRNLYTHHDEYIQALEATDRIFQITDDLPKHTRVKFLISYRWYRYLTIPEALLYHFLLNEKNVPNYFSAKLNIIQVPTETQPLIIDFVLKANGKIIKKWRLFYKLNQLEVLIYEDKIQVGKLYFVIRSKRLEEVEGTYNGKPFVIDPVWTPKQNGVLKEEHLHFGNQKITLSHHGNELEGQWIGTNNKTKHMEIHELPNFVEDKNKVITGQHIHFGEYEIDIKLIFSKGILIPIEGGMIIRKLPSK